ncbi:hypothetical protein GCM10010145_43950 [Streptomyces ruber]|uniref:Uncharacterized protein n=2 Tax=Streptomyces TaxID=1883 RepID=A0A918BIZ1_9ACTN|nr:hypothetical protein [Streptomyces ruber]GGQ69385.1 hypothetical protein GCM10010145_43950 [Streptomyces ruber]
MTVRVSSTVMTHPLRRRQAEALAARLGLGGLSVDPDPDAAPSVLRTALVAWAAVPSWATHHLVVQDDVAAPEGLLGLVTDCAARFPDEVLVFYTNWHARNGALSRLAALAGAGWARAVPEEFTPTLAVCLPAGRAAAFRRYARGRRSERHDDEVMAAFLRREGRAALLAVPGVVEHIGTSSINGHTTQGVRRAACPADLADARPLLRHGWVLEEWGWLPHLRDGVGCVRPAGQEHAPDPRRPHGWREALPGTGLTEAQVRGAARRHRPAAAAAEVGRLFGQDFAAELWTHCLLLGRRAADVTRPYAAGEAAGAERVHQRLRAAALSTVGPAGLPPERRPEVGPAQAELLAAYAGSAVSRALPAPGPAHVPRRARRA